MGESGEDGQPAQPESVMAYVLKELVELQTKVAVLQATVDAQAQMLTTLFVAMPLRQRGDAVTLLCAQQQALEVDGDAFAAQMLGAQIHALKAIFENCSGGMRLLDMAAGLGLGNALVRAAPAHHAQAQRTWLSIATEGEIAQEAEQLPSEQLDALLRLQVAPKPAKRGGVRRGKKTGGD